jgi:ADYC domain
MTVIRTRPLGGLVAKTVRHAAPRRAFALLLCVVSGGACVASAPAEGEREDKGGLSARDGQIYDGPSATLQIPCKEEQCTYEPVRGVYRGCPTGSCDPGSGNGRGVFIKASGNYCLELSDGYFSFCPEGFVSDGKGVMIRLRDYTNPEVVHEAVVSATLDKAYPVELLSVDVQGGELSLTYDDTAWGQQEAMGLDLERLVLEFEATPLFGGGGGPPVKYELTVKGDKPSGLAVPRYEVFYRRAPKSGPGLPWAKHCNAFKHDPRASFFANHRVDGLTAEVVDEPGTVTMSCETGAIDTCLEWGYRPWDDSKTQSLTVSRDLFASCLQAKRAAYLAGLGDPTSYTVDGTEILVRDHFGIRDDLAGNRPEALWGPGGALCLDEMRHESLRTEEITKALERCDPFDWSVRAKFATGLPPPNKP